MKLSSKIVMIALGIFALGTLVYAGNNWSTSTGGAWQTPDDTTAVENSFLVVGSSAVYPTVKVIRQPVVQGQTIAQINVSTAIASGQLVFCSDCVASRLCISTGSANFQQWVVISSIPTSGLVACK